MQHVGKQYTDNLKNEINTVDAYTVFNGMIGYNLQKLIGRNGFNFQLHFRNIFNTIYASHGEGDQFFPGAERQLFSNLKIEL
jgi:outer membrane receptor protein involved in Fe transport